MVDCVEVLGCVGSANRSSVLRVRGVKNEALAQSQAGISRGGVTFVAWPRRAGQPGDGVNIHTYTRLHPANQDIIREISEAERVNKYTGNNHSDKILSTELMDTSR